MGSENYIFQTNATQEKRKKVIKKLQEGKSDFGCSQPKP